MVKDRVLKKYLEIFSKSGKNIETKLFKEIEKRRYSHFLP